MSNTKTQKYYFNNYEIESIVAEPTNTYNLFDFEIADSRIEQLKIFTKLENKFTHSRATSLGNLVHFQNSKNTPVQRWFPYREGYSIKLVDTFIKELNIKKNLFDPFCGSGTTLLSSRFNNLNSFGIDINPLSVLVSKAENTYYGKNEINLFSEVIYRIKNLKKTSEIYHTNFELSDKVFNDEILQVLLQLKNYIKHIDNEKIRDLVFLAWLAIIEDVSNIKKEGNGIKYKNRKRTANGYLNIKKSDWEKHNFPENKYQFVVDRLTRHLNLILTDLKTNYGLINKIPEIFHGDSLNFDKYLDSEIELTFFSPPYCNCFDYFEIHKVELWLGDFVKNKNEFKKLRNMGFRSNTNALLQKPIHYNNTTLEKLISLFDVNKLWHKRIPGVVRGYFDDFHYFLTKLYLKTKTNGYVGIVVGNSAYTGVVIPTDLIISEIASEIGFNVKNIFVTRHLTTSSQQKKQLESLKEYLRESIILLQK